MQITQYRRKALQLIKNKVLSFLIIRTICFIYVYFFIRISLYRILNKLINPYKIFIHMQIFSTDCFDYYESQRFRSIYLLTEIFILPFLLIAAFLIIVRVCKFYNNKKTKDILEFLFTVYIVEALISLFYYSTYIYSR